EAPVKRAQAESTTPGHEGNRPAYSARSRHSPRWRRYDHSRASSSASRWGRSPALASARAASMGVGGPGRQQRSKATQAPSRRRNSAASGVGSLIAGPSAVYQPITVRAPHPSRLARGNLAPDLADQPQPALDGHLGAAQLGAGAPLQPAQRDPPQLFV